MTISHADDLLRVFTITWDAYSGVDPITIEQETDEQINSRFARELLGTLVTLDMIEVLDHAGDDMWHVNEDFFAVAQAQENRAEVLDAVRTMLGMSQPVTKSSTSRPPKPPTPADGEFRVCGCGCGEHVAAKSWYRPGHDARHAGQVGREIAANYTVPGFDRRTLLDTLPSDALRVKAENIAGKVIEKEDAKYARAQAKRARANTPAEAEPEPADRKDPHVEYGTIKVGKNEHTAQRFLDTGEVTYHVGDVTRQASKTAAKTFQVG